MRYNVKPVTEEDVDKHILFTASTWDHSIDMLRDYIAKLEHDFEYEEFRGVNEATAASLLNGIRNQILHHKKLLRKTLNATSAEATPPSTLVSSPYQPPNPDLALMIENPIIWMASLTSTPQPDLTPAPPNLALAKARADYIRAAITNPPIDRWLTALHASYGPLLAQKGDPNHELRVYPSSITRQQATQTTAYNRREHGHRATVLLDFDWHTGLSTPYFVVASKLALAYLQYKAPLDLQNLSSDPLWLSLAPYLPCHTEVWPIGRPAPIQPVTFGGIGSGQKAALTQVKEAVREELQILNTQGIIYETFEIEPRLIQNHAPNWDYQIPKVIFNQDNLFFLNRALQWNSDRVRLARDRRGARGPLWGTRLHLKAFGDRSSDVPDFIFPSHEVVPTELYDEHTRDLCPLEQALPTITSATYQTNKVSLKGIWIL